MDDSPVGEAPPAALDVARQEEAGDQEEIRHPERLGEGNDVMQPALAAKRLAESQGGVHHHDEDDAHALDRIDPGKARGVGGASSRRDRGASLDIQHRGSLSRHGTAWRRGRPSRRRLTRGSQAPCLVQAVIRLVSVHKR
jgi:hypothetical protein